MKGCGHRSLPPPEPSLPCVNIRSTQAESKIAGLENRIGDFRANRAGALKWLWKNKCILTNWLTVTTPKALKNSLRIERNGMWRIQPRHWYANQTSIEANQRKAFRAIWAFQKWSRSGYIHATKVWDTASIKWVLLQIKFVTLKHI
jgi:hypothetical protein